jgi:1-acyl-sn-glycerol-3-phosphate acyltransferase
VGRTLEQGVASVAEEILGDRVRTGESLDADSLDRAELVLALEERFGVRLADGSAYETLREATEAVAEALEGLDGAEPAPLDGGFGRLQWVVETVLCRPLGWAYELRVHGRDNVPAFGPAVLASNHDSLLDIPFLVRASPRPVWFMAKVELFRNRLGSSLLHALGSFPVRRGGRDLRAVRAGLQVLRLGRVLGMYPEGTRARHLQAFLPGAAWVALATGAPLVPVAISGTADAMPRGSVLPRRTHVTVRFGEPIASGKEDDPGPRLKRARGLTDDLRSEIERLLASPDPRRLRRAPGWARGAGS